jgi:hypothetical protein
MWLIADTTQGFFLEFWVFPERKCVVSLKSNLDLEILESIRGFLIACQVVPR